MLRPRLLPFRMTGRRTTPRPGRAAIARHAVNSRTRRDARGPVDALEPRVMLAGLSVVVTALPPGAGTASAIAGDGLDDSAAFQAAVDYVIAERAAGATGPAEIIIPEGTYDLAESIDIFTDDIAFVGDGAGRSIVRAIAGRGGPVDGTQGGDTSVGSPGTNSYIDPDDYLFYAADFEGAGAGLTFRGLTLSGPDLHGALFSRGTDRITIEDSELNGFGWSALRIFLASDVRIAGNTFIDAGGRAFGTSGVTGGGIFATYLRDSEIVGNRFEKSGEYVAEGRNYFGIKGRQFRESLIADNTIATSFAIELPFENDRNVEITRNWLGGVVSIPKFAGGVVFDEPDSAFHIHHNLFTRSYSVELTRNSTLIEDNVFLSPRGDDGGNFLASFGTNNAPGPLTVTGNLFVNPGRGVFWSDPAYDNVSFTNNEILAGEIPTETRRQGLFGFFPGIASGGGMREGTDFSTVTIADNVVEVFGTPRELVRNDATGTANIANNTLANISDTARYANPDTGETRGLTGPLRFYVGAGSTRLVDAASIAAFVRETEGELPPGALDVPPADPDTTEPTLASVRSLDLSTIEVRFDEPVDAATVAAAIDGVAVTAVEATDDLSVVRIVTAPLTAGQSYDITLSGVADLSIGANAWTRPRIATFTAVESAGEAVTFNAEIRTGDGDGAETTLRRFGEPTDAGASDRTNIFHSPSGFHSATLLRFDLSQVDLASQPVEAVELAATLRGGSVGPGVRELNVYGLRDDQGFDGWTETGDGFVQWNDVPGITGSGATADPAATVLLGTILVDNTGFALNNAPDALTLSSPELRDFVAADTDGRISLLIKRVGASNEATQLWTKEGDADLAPALRFRLNTGVPAAPTGVRLLAAFDTGANSRDGLTNRTNATVDSALRFAVDGVAAGDRVTILADGVAIGSAIAVGESVEVLTDGVTPLADGPVAITAIRESADGVSDPSAATTITIESAAPLTAPSLATGVAAGGTVALSLVVPQSAAGNDRPFTVVGIARAAGEASVNADGTLSYVAADGFSGADAFTYTLADAAGNTVTGSVTVTVFAPIDFLPADSGVIDVAAEFGAIPDDGLDDTAAIQAALAEYVGRNRILVLRDGVYDVSDTLVWENPNPTGPNARDNQTELRGQSEAGTVIRLADRADGFDESKFLLQGYIGNSANAFGNYLSDLTLDTGRDNAGAIGLRFQTSNYGAVRRVTVRTGRNDDGTPAAGQTGINQAFNFPGPMLFEDVTVDGFATGVLAAPQEFSIVFDGLTLRNQTEVGIGVWRTPLSISRLDAELAVPVFVNRANPGAWGHTVITDSTVVGLDPTVAAFVNEAGSGFTILRDVETSGFGLAVDDLQAGATVADGTVGFYSTEQPRTLSDTVERGIDLPVERFEDFDPPPSEWVSVRDSASVDAIGNPIGSPDDIFDDTAAIQAALDDGRAVVYLPTGDYNIRETLVIPPHVRRLVGFDARLSIDSGLADRNEAVFRIVGESEHGLSIERFEENISRTPRGYLFEHASTRTLQIRDVVGGGANGTYRNTVAGGRVFLENVTGGLYRFEGQRVWGQQVNLEPVGTKLINIGGDLWINGLKTEQAGTLVETYAGGRTEVLGGLAYPSNPNVGFPMFINDESSVAFTIAESAYIQDGWYPVWVAETRDGVTRTVDRADLTGHSNLGKKIGWYSGVLTEAAVPDAVADLTATAAADSVTLSWTEDPAARRYLIFRDGTLVGATVAGQASFTDDASGTGLSDATAYAYTVVAESKLGVAGEPGAIGVVTATDSAAPALIDGRTLGLTTIALTFSEPVDAAGAAATVSTAGQQVAVQAIAADGNRLLITTEELMAGEPYGVVVTGLTDTATIPNAAGPIAATVTAIGRDEAGRTFDTVIRTGDGDGADATLSRTRPDIDRGGSDNVNVSSSPAAGNFVDAGLLRFDLSGVDLRAQRIEAAQLTATLKGGVVGSGQRLLNVFGVRDELGFDDWTETGDGYVTYGDVPGITTSSRSVDGDRIVFLGTLFVDNAGFALNNRPDALRFSSDALAEFVAADGDGRVTLLLKRTTRSNEQTQLWSKEGNPDLAPALRLALVPRQAAAPIAVRLAEESDTGVSQADGITRLANADDATRLRVLVDGVRVGDLVTVLADGVAIGSAVALSETAEIVTDGATLLADGEVELTAIAQGPDDTPSERSAATTITVDTVGPTASVIRPPGNATVDALGFDVSEAVFGLDATDFTLTRDGVAADLSGAMGSDIDGTPTLAGLTDAFFEAGLYELLGSDALDATDAAGNALTIAAGVIEMVARRFEVLPGAPVLVDHDPTYELASGTVAVSFLNRAGRGTLFSKDGYGYGTGGHLTAKVSRDKVIVRLQSESRSYKLVSGPLARGQWHDVAVEFGEGGFRLVVNGEEVAAREDITVGLTGNRNTLAIGASTERVRPDLPVADQIRGVSPNAIADVRILDADGNAVYQTAAVAAADITSTETDTVFAGDSAPILIADDPSQQLADGRIGLTFSVTDAEPRQALFSKDNSGFDDGGHITAYVQSGRLIVRLQSGEASHYVRSARGAIAAGVEYDMEVRFGSGGLRLLIDGQLVDTDAYTGGLVGNTNPIAIGANIWSAREEADRVDDLLAGTIRGFYLEDDSPLA